MIDDLEFRAGKLVHEFCSVAEALIKFAIKNPEAIDSMFDGEIIPSQFGMMNLIIAHQRWREAQKRKPDVNERLCQVRH